MPINGQVFRQWDIEGTYVRDHRGVKVTMFTENALHDALRAHLDRLVGTNLVVIARSIWSDPGVFLWRCGRQSVIAIGAIPFIMAPAARNQRRSLDVILAMISTVDRATPIA